MNFSCSNPQSQKPHFIQRQGSLLTILTSSQDKLSVNQEENLITKAFDFKPEKIPEFPFLLIRPLEASDYHKGFLTLLSQLTVIGEVTFQVFQETFEQIKNNEDQLVLIIENTETSKIVAAGTLLIERKFIHESGLVGHIEDIVVDTTQRGQNLGKRIVEKLRDIGGKSGCYKVILDCNENLVGFYEKCGFTKKAVQMAWYKEEQK